MPAPGRHPARATGSPGRITASPARLKFTSSPLRIPSCARRPECPSSRSCLHGRRIRNTGPGVARNGYSMVHGFVYRAGSSMVTRYRMVFASTRLKRSITCNSGPRRGTRLLRGEIGGVHHQRVAFPMPDRIAQPLLTICGRFVRRVHADHADVVHHLDQDHDRVLASARSDNCCCTAPASWADRRSSRIRSGSAPIAAGSSRCRNAVPSSSRGAARIGRAPPRGGILPSGGSMISEVRFPPSTRASSDPRSMNRLLYPPTAFSPEPDPPWPAAEPRDCRCRWW